MSRTTDQVIDNENPTEEEIEEHNKRMWDEIGEQENEN